MLISFMTRIITAGILFAGALAISLGSSPTQALEGNASKAGLPAPALSDQIIVRLASPALGRLNATQVNALSAAAGERLQVVRAMSRNGLVLKLPAFRELPEVAAIARRLVGVAGIADAEPDEILLPQQVVPEDPRYAEQWHYFEAAGGINLPLAWEITTGSPDIAVAVIDTGVRPHADLAARLLPGYDFIHDAWSANDGDGWDADASDPGDWLTAAETSYPCPTAHNSTWHGTHVAGTVGAATDNGLGVAGVTWDTGVLPVRVMGKCGGYTSDILDGMVWASGMPDPYVPSNLHPAKVLNLSLGGVSNCTPAFQGVINDIVAYGATVVVAAANGNTDAKNYQPANCAHVITVAATDRAGNRAGSSNYGSAVEISAPGVSILSTLNTGTTVPGDDTYALYSGTSMAAPHVAGVVGLMYSLNPALTPAHVVELLQASARPFPAGSTCYDPVKTCGAGIVDAAAALNAVLAEVLPVVAISAPVDGATFWEGQNITFTGTATAPQEGDLSASLIWTSSLSGSMGTGGTFTRSLAAGNHVITAEITDPTSGLKVAQRVNVTVLTNAAPTVTITSPADGSTFPEEQAINFTGTATDAEDGDLTGSIQWTSSLDGVLGTGGSVTASALSAGTHTIEVRVTDSIGQSAVATISVTVLPNAVPTVTIISPANGSTFPAGQGMTFTGIATDAEDGNLTGSIIWTSRRDGSLGTGGSVTASALSAGTHTIEAQVTDSHGQSAVVTITVTVQAPPASVTVTFTSIGSEDGQVLESSETSNLGGSATASSSTLLVGDNAKDYQYKLFLSFDTSGLPNGATITSATVRLRRSSLTGTDPFSTHGDLLVDIRTGGFGGSAALAKSDFQAAATATGVASLSNADSNGIWSEGALNADGLAAVNKAGRTQFRIYFATDDNDDRNNDYLGYYAGENATATNRPQLVVTYQP